MTAVLHPILWPFSTHRSPQFMAIFNEQISVELRQQQQEEEEQEEEETACEVCGRSDREDRLLLCDGCDLG